MIEIWDQLKGFWEREHLVTALRVALLVFLLLPVMLLFSAWLRRRLTKLRSAQEGLVISKLVRYATFVMVTLLICKEVGFSLSPLLGAAGIVGVAVAFASQTSVSNVISGVFLIAEKPFMVGDAITVGTTTGVVLSIDTLSIKLRTFDNRFVRIPNETIIKSEVTTITRFPIRRLDLRIGVAYKEDMERVNKVLKEVADANPLCLMEPAPLFIIEGFGDSSVNFLFGVWVAREHYLKLKNSIQSEILKRFAEEQIEIPYPHRLLIQRADNQETVTETD